jgi:hypothetical protein
MSLFQLPVAPDSSIPSSSDEEIFPYDNPQNVVQYTPLFQFNEIIEFGLSFKLPKGVDASAAVLLEFMEQQRT